MVLVRLVHLDIIALVVREAMVISVLLELPHLLVQQLAIDNYVTSDF